MMTFRTTVLGPHGAIQKAFVSASGQGSGRIYRRETDGGGYADVACFQLDAGEGVTLKVTADGYRQYTGYDVADVDKDLVIRLEPSAAPFDVRESGIIRRTTSRGFVREDGSPWYFAGLSLHCLLPVMIRDEAAAHARFEDMARLGANTAWMFGTHLSPWKQAHGYYHDPRHPDHPAQLARLCDMAAEHQKRLCYGLLTDCDFGLSDVNEQRALFARDAGLVKNRWNVVIYTPGNEDRANGWRAENFSRVDAGSVLLSRGDRGNGENDQPCTPYWDVNMWETRCTYQDTPDYKVLDDAGTGSRELQHGYDGKSGHIPGFDGPLLIMETDIFSDTSPDAAGDQRNTDPAFACALGVNMSANCAGGSFGTSASLEAQANGPIADQCAREFYRGFWRGAVR